MCRVSPSHIRATAVRVATLRRLALSVLFIIRLSQLPATRPLVQPPREPSIKGNKPMLDMESSPSLFTHYDTCHTDLHPGRNVYLTSWFILSVLFLTGGETSEVPTCVWDPPHMNLHHSRNIYLNSWFMLSLLFLTNSETSVVPTCFADPLSHGPPAW